MCSITEMWPYLEEQIIHSVAHPVIPAMLALILNRGERQYAENYKTQVKQMEKDTDEWKSKVHGLEDLCDIVNMSPESKEFFMK